MIVTFKYQINKKKNQLVYITTNEHGVQTTKIIPIRDENGVLTKEFVKETKKKKFISYYEKINNKAKATVVEQPVVEEKKDEAKSVSNNEIARVDAEIVEPKTTDIILPETQKYEIVEYQEAPAELKEKKKFSWKKFLFIAGLIGIGVFAATKIEGCNKKDETKVTATPTPGVDKDEENLKVSPTPTPEKVPTVEEQLEDSRYTKITNEKFEETVFNLQKELTSHGIELEGAEVVKFVTLLNLTHMQETNPELLKSVMGEDTDPQQFISSASKVIGQVVYLEVTDKNEQVKWTDAIMDKKDKEIADDYMNNVVYAAKEYAEGDPIIEGGTYATREEKRIHIETLVAEGYIVKDFDKTSDTQEIGADFVTDAIVTGILLNDNSIKQYIETQEVVDELTVISSNKDAVSNLHTLISTVCCSESPKVLTLQ